MGKTEIGKAGDTLIEDLGAGRKLSIINTPAGLRVNLHEGGVTRPVDPAAYGAKALSGSAVGGGNSHLTLTTADDKAVDFTQRQDGTLDERIHEGGTSHKK